jgi:hypothetical protein
MRLLSLLTAGVALLGANGTRIPSTQETNCTDIKTNAENINCVSSSNTCFGFGQQNIYDDCSNTRIKVDTYADLTTECSTFNSLTSSDVLSCQQQNLFDLQTICGDYTANTCTSMTGDVCTSVGYAEAITGGYQLVNSSGDSRDVDIVSRDELAGLGINEGLLSSEYTHVIIEQGTTEVLMGVDANGELKYTGDNSAVNAAYTYNDQTGELEARTVGSQDECLDVDFSQSRSYTFSPTQRPVGAPTAAPTVTPTLSETVNPTKVPTGQPSSQPSGKPSNQPTTEPTVNPTKVPTGRPSSQPSGQPSSQPTGQPSSQPSGNPSAQPTVKPSSQPTGLPTEIPTSIPSAVPSLVPTSIPTHIPTLELDNGQPTVEPSAQPSRQPTTEPTDMPSSQPTGTPTGQPSSQSTGFPTEIPTNIPTGIPSVVPSSIPTTIPTLVQDTYQPSRQPMDLPTGTPTSNPTTSTIRDNDDNINPNASFSDNEMMSEEAVIGYSVAGAVLTIAAAGVRYGVPVLKAVGFIGDVGGQNIADALDRV